MHQISLSPEGNLRLHLPCGRTLDCSPTEHGAKALARALYNYETPPTKREKPVFLTQHIIDTWERQDRAKKEREFIEKTAQVFDIDVTKLDFTL